MTTFVSRRQPVQRKSADSCWPLRFCDRDAAPRKAEGFEAEGQQPGPTGIARNPLYLKDTNHD